jgi:hypothetical protein
VSNEKQRMCVNNILMFSPQDIPDYTGPPHPCAEVCRFLYLYKLEITLNEYFYAYIKLNFRICCVKCITTFENSVGTSYMVHRRSI